MDKVSDTIIQMLTDRNYIINSKIDNLITKINDNLLVYFVEESKVGINNIKCVQETLDNHNVNHGIIVYIGNITAFAKTFIDKLREERYELEFFNYNELLYNITHHSLVPKHRLLSHDEKSFLLKHYKVSEKHIPCILRTDPVSRYYNAKPGNVFEILRSSDVCFKSISYRIVI